MTPTSNDCPLLIAVIDLFCDHRPQTLRTVVNELNIPEEAALEALERLEDQKVIVRARGGTDTPVWKPYGSGKVSWLRSE